MCDSHGFPSLLKQWPVAALTQNAESGRLYPWTMRCSTYWGSPPKTGHRHLNRCGWLCKASWKRWSPSAQNCARSPPRCRSVRRGWAKHRRTHPNHPHLTHHRHRRRSLALRADGRPGGRLVMKGSSARWCRLTRWMFPLTCGPTPAPTVTPTGRLPCRMRHRCAAPRSGSSRRSSQSSPNIASTPSVARSVGNL